MKYDSVEKTNRIDIWRDGKGRSNGEFLFYEQSKKYLNKLREVYIIWSCKVISNKIVIK